MKHSLVFILLLLHIGVVCGQEILNGEAAPIYSGADTSDTRKKFPAAKNDINLILTSLRINGFNFEPQGFGTRVNSGIWGFSFGLEYYYKSNKFFGIKSAVATDGGLPIHTTPDVVNEGFNTAYVELTDNLKFGRWYFGFGLSYALNTWWYSDERNPDNYIGFRSRNKSFGILSNAYFQIGKPFFIGLVYRPTFFRIDPVTDFKYEHLISIDIAFKIPLKYTEY